MYEDIREHLNSLARHVINSDGIILRALRTSESENGAEDKNSVNNEMEGTRLDKAYYVLLLLLLPPPLLVIIISN
jgi:hypothetical protein